MFGYISMLNTWLYLLIDGICDRSQSYLSGGIIRRGIPENTFAKYPIGILEKKMAHDFS